MNSIKKIDFNFLLTTTLRIFSHIENYVDKKSPALLQF